MAEMQSAPAGAGPGQKLLTWVDNRFPLSKLYNEHMAEYYAPKNFNFWYVFGSLALLVLVMQILTGIFLTMHYKPDATQGFRLGRVHHARRAGRAGSSATCTRPAPPRSSSSVYLHMFRGLICTAPTASRAS